ncbi:hypothetical protein [Flavobacterium sp. MMS24-S5]|uniref:hypothetical protein n=1 Tax=Flavobacterium sp. MMS24-S5 TaxID=3416605 RepID=UPI003CFF92C3
MFDNLDFKILNNSDYKEDSVREDIIMPILKRLGYSSTGNNKIRRGISLIHPFVNIGSTQRKINIVPDYILETENGFQWILDAKSPNENILKSGNVEQAYSYAINPEIRSKIYALCNGRKLTVFHISETEPLLSINIEDIDQNWASVQEILSPLHLEKPFLKFFIPDLGIHLSKLDNDLETPYFFVPSMVQGIHKINDDLYTIFSVVSFDQEFSVSLDFSSTQFNEFIDAVPEDLREKIIFRLKNAPFNILFQTEEELFPITIEAKRTEIVYNNGNEEYIPLKAIKFTKF